MTREEQMQILAIIKDAIAKEIADCTRCNPDDEKTYKKRRMLRNAKSAVYHALGTLYDLDHNVFYF